MKANNLLDEIYKAIANDNSKLNDMWFTHIVFSWRWWLLVLLSIIPWIIWVKLRSKNDTVKLLFVGLIVSIISNALDTIGMNFNLWHYDWKVFPFISLYFPWDFTLLPVSIMLLLQFKPNINKYIKAVVFSFMCSFVFEPLFTFIGVYHPILWEYWYSFVIYTLLFLFYNRLYNCRLLQRQSN